MYLHLFNGSEPVLLSIENSSYKPKLSLTCNQVTVEAELTAADKENIAKFFGYPIENVDDFEDELEDLQKERDDWEEKHDAIEEELKSTTEELHEAYIEIGNLKKQIKELK